MDVICIDRITIAFDKLQVAIKYTFDLAVCNVGEKLPYFFFSRRYIV